MRYSVEERSRFSGSFRLEHFVFLFVMILAGSGLALASVDVTQVDDPKKLIKTADQMMRRGDFSEAEKLYRQASSLDPNNSDAKLKVAYALFKQRFIVECYEMSLEVATKEPTNARAFSLVGTALLGAGRFEESRQVLLNALRLDRRDALAWGSLGLLDFYENNLPESIANLREAVYHDSRNPDYVFSLAQVTARAELYKEAADAYNRFLRVSKNTDDERRARIRGLIRFLRFLSTRGDLYIHTGSDDQTVPFALKTNRPVIELRLNGKDRPYRFVLDTGSGISVISDETAESLGISPVTRGGYAKGIGGNGRFEIIYGFLKTVEIGEVKMRNVPVYIRTFHRNAADIDGYIGLSLISKFLTTVDYGARTFSLEKIDGSSQKPDGVTVPLRLTSSGFLSGEVQMEGVQAPLNFIVDTGASVSVISDELASMDALNPFIRPERLTVIGAAGVTEDVPTYALPKLRFGSHDASGITAVALDLDIINEASGFEQAGILGGNFLRNYKMTFDFKNSHVTFVPIGTVP